MNLPHFSALAAPARMALPAGADYADLEMPVSSPAAIVPTDAATLVDLLRTRASDHPHRRAFTYAIDGEDKRAHLTYGELDAEARGIAARLQQAGLEGERALLLYPSGLEFVAAFFGCLYAGVVAVPAYPPRRNRNAGRIEAVVRDADARIVLSTEHALARTGRIVAEDAHLRDLPWWATDVDTTAHSNQWRPPQVSANDLAFLQYTSGSTGDPKGVMLTHHNLMQNAAVIRAGFETSPNDIAVFWLPLYHDMGLIGGILQPLYAGIWCTLMSPAHFLQQPLRWLQMISKQRATISGGPNFAYDLCVERITDQAKCDLDLSHWELAFNGAEPVRAETLDRFAEKFADCGFRREAFYPCYGLAESTLLVAGGRRAKSPRRLDVDPAALQADRLVAGDNASSSTLVACGKGLLDQEVRIVDPERQVECLAGEVGEIWVSGGSVAAGYWRRPEATHETFAARLPGQNKHFLRTGDLGAVEGGQLFVTGRCKDLIIIRGVNHYPHDVEHTARSVDPVLATGCCAAFAVPSGGGEQLVVVQEIARRDQPRAAELQSAIHRGIAQSHDVVPVVLLTPVNSIPKTSSGKLQRSACRRAYLDGAFTEIVPSRKATRVLASSPEADLVAVVTSAIRAVAKDRARTLTEHTHLVDVGLDSLERMEIVAALEDHFGGRFSEQAVLDMETPADIVQAVKQQLLSAGERFGSPLERQIEPADYDFAQSPEYLRLHESLRLTDRCRVVNPYFTVHEGVTGDRTTIDGREFVNFCSYNYLGMSGDPVVIGAAQAATARYGTSVSASRLVSGEKPLHGQLERAVAEFLGVESAITLVGGHATNETTIGHLFGPGDLILHDALSHNSIVQGCKLSGAHRRAFPHNKPAVCHELLARYRREYRRVLIVIEGVYSMDGDIAPLPEFVELKEKFKTYLMVDEAHSLGTLGVDGRGIAAHFDVDPQRVDLWMGTLSKSLGSCGGYIAARRELVEYLKYTAPGFVYSVGMSPANTAAALASLMQLQREPERVERLARNAALFLSLAIAAGLDTGASRGTPIVPVITGNSARALQLADRLFRAGVNVQPILHPAVEESAARLRFFITSEHSESQIRQAVALTARHWRELSAEASAA